RRGAAPGRRLEDGEPDQRRDRRAARLLEADRDPEAGGDPRHLGRGVGAMSDTHYLSAVSPEEARQIVRACDRFEAAWRAGQRPRPEGYLGAASGPARAALLRQLLLLDWEYRRRAGDDPRA